MMMIVTVSEALNSMGVNTIRRFARNMWIYIGMELLKVGRIRSQKVWIP